jgi:hypothetical protein
MINDASALKAAVDLLSVPSRARPMRSAPLPGGIATLLQIASGDGEATSGAASITGRSRETVREAAAFFIEQVLLAPDSDSYRILGGAPELPADELRRNMALLLRWLHPDMANSADDRANRSIYATRVTRAWEELKTPERRAAYDAMRQAQAAKSARQYTKPASHPQADAPSHAKSARSVGSRDQARRRSGRGRPAGIWRTLAIMLGARR